MGNHIIAQRMIGTIPLACSTLLCVRRSSKMPTKSPGSPWTIPAHTLESFNTPQITKVGLELDHKVAALLEHLGTRVPEELAYS